LSARAAKPRLVVFDWAGTTVDHGCFGPVLAIVRAFARQGIEVAPAEARAPMGLHKKDHLRAMLAMPAVADRWRRARGRDWAEEDVASLYRELVPLQLEAIGEHCRVVPGLLACLTELRDRGFLIGATTGYFRAAAERVYRAARDQGFEPDHSVCADEVPQGRPAPWMIYRIMERLNVYPPSAVVKVGDTVPDVGEGLSAGTWSVGVTRAGSAVGCTEEELAALGPDERRARLAAARATLLQAGAHAVLESLGELPALLAELGEALRRGERP
jgi:phosphonoacetaldehyde hydrolase